MKNYKKTSVDNFISVRSFQTFFYFELDGHTHTNKDCHNFPEILYVAKGTHQLYIDTTYFELNEGDLIIYAPNSEHYSPVPQHSHIAITSFDVDSDALSPLYNKVISLSDSQRDLLSKIIKSGLELFNPIPPDSNLMGMTLRDDAEDFQVQMLKNMLELLLAELCSQMSVKSHSGNAINYKNHLTDEIIDYMKINLNSNLSLSQICADFQISMSTLKKLFKERCNCAPKTYYTNLKIEEAKRLIRDTTLNFTEISEKLHFNSIHHFSKLFKEKTTFTPSEYSKSINNK